MYGGHVITDTKNSNKGAAKYCNTEHHRRCLEMRPRACEASSKFSFESFLPIQKFDTGIWCAAPSPSGQKKPHICDNSAAFSSESQLTTCLCTVGGILSENTTTGVADTCINEPACMPISLIRLKESVRFLSSIRRSMIPDENAIAARRIV